MNKKSGLTSAFAESVMRRPDDRGRGIVDFQNNVKSDTGPLEDRIFSLIKDTSR